MDRGSGRPAGYPGMNAEDLARLQRLTGSYYPGAAQEIPAGMDRNTSSQPAQNTPGPNDSLFRGIPVQSVNPATGSSAVSGPTAPAAGNSSGTAGAADKTAAASNPNGAPAQPIVQMSPAAGMLPMNGMFPPNRMYSPAAAAAPATPAAPNPAPAAGTGEPRASSAGNPEPPQDEMDADLQEFMAQGYLMGPNCFGRDSRIYAGQMMEYINDEYQDYRTYQALARRAPDRRARIVFRNIAADEMRHARRWAAAYFLITGKRYFPDRGSIEAADVSSYPQALRERYLAESRDAVKYRRFARETSDRCLRRLANEASDDERQHAQQILELIQRQY